MDTQPHGTDPHPDDRPENPDGPEPILAPKDVPQEDNPPPGAAVDDE